MAVIGSWDLVLGARGETIGKIGENGEDALAEVFLKFRLCAQGLLANEIKPAFAVCVTLESFGGKECEEVFEILR